MFASKNRMPGVRLDCLAISSAAVSLMLGCAPPEADAQLTDVDERTQPAVLDSGYVWWTSPGPLTVCFTGPASRPPNTAEKTQIETWFTTYWAGSIGLQPTFVTCPTTIPGDWISVYVDWVNGTGNGQAATGGRGSRLAPLPRFDNRTDIQIYLGASYSKDNVVHEFGHVLGLRHEHSRPDRLEDCSDPALPNDGKALTEFDPESGMGYGTKSGESCGMAGGYGTPSRLDLLAMEALYPKTSADVPLSLGCFSGPCFLSGNGVIGMGDAAVSPDWIARGLWGGIFEGPSEDGGGTFDAKPRGYALVSSAGTSSGVVRRYGLISPNGLGYKAEGTVVSSSGLYTALMLALLR